MPDFHRGELFELTFETSRGPCRLLAEIEIENKILWLKDIVIEALFTRKLNINVREVFAARRQLMELARAGGFRVLRLPLKDLWALTLASVWTFQST